MANRIIEFLVDVKGNIGSKFEELGGAIGKAKDALVSFKGLIAGLIAGAVVKGIQTLVHAFSEQEQVINKLNAALRVSGRFTDEASRAIQDMAKKMQETTTHSTGEAIGISAQFASQAKQLTATQLAEAQQLAIGFADATGRSVEGAASLIIRSLTGQGNALKRYGIDLDSSASQQQKFQQLQAKLGPMFAISQEAANTLGGRIKQAHNEFNDFKETLGNIIVKIFDLKGVAEGTRDTFKSWKTTIQEHSGQIIAWGQGILEILKTVFDAVGILWEFFKLGAIVLFNTGKGIIAAIKVVGDVITIVGLEVSAFFDKIKDKVIDWANDLIIILNKVSPVEIPLFAHGPRIAEEFLADAKSSLNQHVQDYKDANQAIEDHSVAAAATIGTKWDNLFTHLQTGIGIIRSAPNQLPAAGPEGSGKGPNLRQPTDSDPEADLRAVMAEQKMLEAQYRAGFATHREYMDGLAAQEGKLRALIPQLQGNKDALVQVFGALAHVKGARLDNLLGQADKLKAAFDRGEMSVKEYDDSMKVLVGQLEEVLRAAGLTEEQIKKFTKAMTDGKASLMGMGAQFKKAFGLEEGGGAKAVADANAEVAKMTFGLATGFTDAIGQALFAGANFGKAIQKAVGEAAKAFAKQAIGRSIMELAEGFASLAIHDHKGASQHFKAAATFGAAAVVMGGIGAAIGGGGGGGGGAGGGAAAGAQASAGGASKGSATVFIEGGVLDMSNPEQAEAFRKAMAELSDREVIIKVNA